jgi:hypothetical protein
MWVVSLIATLRGSLKYNAKALTVDRTIQVTIEAPAPQ